MEQKAWIRKQSGMTTAGQTESCCMERGLEKSEIEIREKNGVTYLAFPALGCHRSGKPCLFHPPRRCQRGRVLYHEL